MESMNIVKVGGAIVEDEQRLGQLLYNICALSGNKKLDA